MRHSSNRTWFHVVLGLFFLALMLFPVYWMVNASLQPGGAPGASTGRGHR